jgi:hypothetical protein
MLPISFCFAIFAATGLGNIHWNKSFLDWLNGVAFILVIASPLVILASFIISVAYLDTEEYKKAFVVSSMPFLMILVFIFISF